MVVRSWEGRSRPGAAPAYLRYLTEVMIPAIQAVPGNEGVQVLQGEGEAFDTFVVLSLWSDIRAIEAFAGPDPERAVVPSPARALLADFAERARHFDVVFDMRREVP